MNHLEQLRNLLVPYYAWWQCHSAYMFTSQVLCMHKDVAAEFVRALATSVSCCQWLQSCYKPTPSCIMLQSPLSMYTAAHVIIVCSAGQRQCADRECRDAHRCVLALVKSLTF